LNAAVHHFDDAIAAARQFEIVGDQQEARLMWVKSGRGKWVNSESPELEPPPLDSSCY
jgi:hypothetical protein